MSDLSDAHRTSNVEHPADAARGPDALCELLVDLVCVPLAQLSLDGFQAWVHTTSICVALLKGEPLRHWWIQRVASRMLMEFPGYRGGPPQCVADFTARLLHAPGEWAAWKADYAPPLAAESPTRQSGFGDGAKL